MFLITETLTWDPQHCPLSHITPAFSQMSDEEMEYSDDDFDAYYEEEFDRDVDHVDPHKNDPEYFHVACLTDTEVERLLNESVEQLSNSIQVGC